MVGKSRIKEKCPLCKGKIEGEPLRRLTCKIPPTRYYLDLYWKRQHKLYSDHDGYPLFSWEQASRFLAHIRYEIDRERQSKGEVIFDPRDYVRRDLNALKFENYARTWLTWRAEEIEYDGISRGYLKSVESYLRNHIVPFFEGLNIREIQEGHIDDFRRHLPRHLRSKTVKNILGILGKIFQDAYGRRDIERIPIIPRVKRETPPIRCIEEEDQERILARVDDPVYRVFFLFLMKQGCRPNEGRAHKWDRVDFRRNQVIINAAVDEGWVSTSAYTKGPNIRGLPSH